MLNRPSIKLIIATSLIIASALGVGVFAGLQVLVPFTLAGVALVFALER